MLITDDGSPTLYNEDYKDYYHSKSGAVQEAVEKYVKPCRIATLAKKGHVRILDIGFGLGYNAIAAVDAAMESNPGCEIEIVSLEKDRAIFDKLQVLKVPLEHYAMVGKLEFDPITDTYLYEDKNIRLKIKLGDAVLTITKLTGQFGAVFLDPFSPAKNPELWTPDFLSAVCQKMKKGALLSTYSYARAVRDNLRKAGFTVRDGPIVGRRSPSTLAKK